MKWSVKCIRSGAPSLTLAAIAERCGFPRPACGERATRIERKSDVGPVRGRFHKLRLAGAPPHPDLVPHAGRRSAPTTGTRAKQASE